MSDICTINQAIFSIKNLVTKVCQNLTRPVKPESRFMRNDLHTYSRAHVPLFICAFEKNTYDAQ